MARTAKQAAALRKAQLASARKRKGKGKGKKKAATKPQKRVMSKKEKGLRYAVAAASFTSAGIQTYRFVKRERQLARSKRRR